MSDLKLIELRPMNDGDIPYIYSSWMEDFLSSHHIKGKKSTQTHVALMYRSLYYKEQRHLIDKILKKSKVTIACNSEDESQILGYVVHRSIGVEIGLMSWIYVRPIYRGFGICNMLMKSIGTMDVVTHLTPQRRWILKKYNLIFNPYMEGYDD